VRALAVGVFFVCLAAGVTFMGQGVGLIKGSFMTGRIEWAIIGSLLAALGAIGLWAIFRPKEPMP
jgi:hypothetical protein